MINVTKEELEDIWQNKPYGYWDSFRKQQKGRKRYKVKLQPFRKDYYEEKEFTVIAKSSDEAYNIAKSQMYDMFKGQPIDGWRLMGAVFV
jgi:hypothetical protein